MKTHRRMPNIHRPKGIYDASIEVLQRKNNFLKRKFSRLAHKNIVLLNRLQIQEEETRKWKELVLKNDLVSRESENKDHKVTGNDLELLTEEEMNDLDLIKVEILQTEQEMVEREVKNIMAELIKLNINISNTCERSAAFPDTKISTDTGSSKPHMEKSVQHVLEKYLTESPIKGIPEQQKYSLLEKICKIAHAIQTAITDDNRFTRGTKGKEGMDVETIIRDIVQKYLADPILDEIDESKEFEILELICDIAEEIQSCLTS